MSLMMRSRGIVSASDVGDAGPRAAGFDLAGGEVQRGEPASHTRGPNRTTGARAYSSHDTIMGPAKLAYMSMERGFSN